MNPGVYAELQITTGGGEQVNEEHEVRQLENLQRQTSPDTVIHSNDIFKTLLGQEKAIRNVLTKGIAGVGKTFTVKKFTLDWVEGRANQDKELVLSLPFRELTLIKEPHNLHDVLISFHPELRKMEVKDYSNCKIVIILDGLDESRLPLDFWNNQVVTDIAEVTSVDVLLTNLIQGNLLPSALLWITSRPAASNQIPPKYIDQVTEVCGFTDPHKESYFRAKFSKNQKLASRIIKNLYSSRSLHIMCHIPVFCWITGIFEKMLEENETSEIPHTLTEMLAYFLLLQTKQKNKKYDETVLTHTQQLLETHREFLLKLGKLAFEHLEKSNLIFYEEDLQSCGLDVTEASVQSGFFSSILKEESLLYQKKVFSFVHLIVQEFFAALYVFDCFTKKNLQPLQSFLKLKSEGSHKDLSLHELLKATVDRALESKNRHLDLFLRFLLGLSLEANQKILTGLLTQTDPETPRKVLTYLKAIRRKGLSPERCINLFQCMVEMRDVAVKNELQEYLESKTRSQTELSPVLCSSLAYMLLVSEEDLETFDLKIYNTTQAGRERLIPVVRCCKKARLSRCQLTESSVKHLALALEFPSSPLRELDLGNNDLGDSGIELLSAGLQSSHCRLETLKLSGCLVTEKGCGFLASALSSNPSHLRELDLSYNHPGDSGVKMLTELQANPIFKLEKLKLRSCPLSHGADRPPRPATEAYRPDSCCLLRDVDFMNRSLL
ncbi:LOW QUALITY PROTEIN: protein NLRC3-like [Aplochiton taeniatus]